MKNTKYVAWLEGRDYWKFECDAVYVKDDKAVTNWVMEHGDVWEEPFEYGTEYRNDEGCVMFHITDFYDITVDICGNEEIWRLA